MEKPITTVLLWIGAAFFLFEMVIHGLVLPILEYDKIFLPTHDRYIALFALTYAVLLVLITSDWKKYDVLFKLVMVGILLAMANAIYIAYSGGYADYFPVNELDQELSSLGLGVFVWYGLTLIFYYLKK